VKKKFGGGGATGAAQGSTLNANLTTTNQSFLYE